MIVVREIPPELTYDIRHIVLREGLPRESCYWETDRMAGAFHLGCWLDTRQVGVATFQPEEEPDCPGVAAYRLRGMAVLPGERGVGAGTLMLLTGENRLMSQGVSQIWCDARVGAAGFYQRNRWQKTGEEFEIPTAGLHIRMRKSLSWERGCSLAL